MLLALTCHPDTPCNAVSRIEVNLARDGNTLALRYVAVGDVGRLALPDRQARGRADELWKTTCFEAFVRTGEGYAEINLSPSDRWAAYGFRVYRDGDMNQLGGVSLTHMTQRAGEGLYELVATLDLSGLADLPAGAWFLGLSAVIEETTGGKSYWALAHGPDKLDFHHHDSFACLLEPS